MGGLIDLDTALAGAKRPERTVSLCLRGDLVAAWEDAERDLQSAQKADTDSLAGNPAAREAAERMEALGVEMQAATVVLRLRGLSRTELRALIDAHPPDTADKRFNDVTFFPALIVACLQNVSAAQWAKIDDVMSAGQFQELSDAAWAVSAQATGVPKSWLASEVLRSAAGKPSSPDS